MLKQITMVKLQNNEKATLFSIMSKYDSTFPLLGDALSNIIQGSDSDSDITVIDTLICSNTLDKEDKSILDRIFLLRTIEMNF